MVSTFDKERTRLAVAKILAATTLLTEPADMTDRWLTLADAYGPVGKPAHDLRLAALMVAHGVTDILTLNAADFKRYREVKPFVPGER